MSSADDYQMPRMGLLHIMARMEADSFETFCCSTGSADQTPSGPALTSWPARSRAHPRRAGVEASAAPCSRAAPTWRSGQQSTSCSSVRLQALALWQCRVTWHPDLLSVAGPHL